MFSPAGVPEDLKFISLPNDVPLSNVKNYAYRSEIPNLARIYIIDSGMDTSTSVCKFFAITLCTPTLL